jgi:hypothetical protein
MEIRSITSPAYLSQKTKGGIAKLRFVVRFSCGQSRNIWAVNEFQARKISAAIASKNGWIISSFGRA